MSTRELGRDELYLHLTRASTIRPRPVKYLWRNRIPLGALTLMGGREGRQKRL